MNINVWTFAIIPYMMWDDTGLNCSKSLKSPEEKGTGEVTLPAHANFTPLYKRR